MSDAVAPALAAIRGDLVVSCQAPPGDPMRDREVLARLAASVVRAGAVGVRVNGIEVVRRTRALVSVPVIGLWKDGDEGVYITPTPRHALDVAEAGADIVAIDGTARPRPDGRTVADSILAVHRRTGAVVLADVSTVDEGLAAVEAGADAVATTLSGYTGPGTPPAGPDLELAAALVDKLGVPVIAEGRIHSPEQARAALDAGVWAVVVGTAITSPAWLTGQYRAGLAS